LESEAIRNLLPFWLNQEKINEILSYIETVKRVALPSVLELLQKGFGRYKDARGSCLTDGLSPSILSSRFVSLSYQHRMHPDISKFPREKIYNNESLKDPCQITSSRNWSYNEYFERAGWIQTIQAKPTSQESNWLEVDIIFRELNLFIKWASSSNSCQGKTWKVAILTFYRRQESIIRRQLQIFFRSNARTHFLSLDKKVEVSLGTVDRFQGHEADIVFLSFVRNRGAGFLDSLNRLNVAITRARYQLVLVGNKQMFANLKRKCLVKELAETLPVLKSAWKENGSLVTTKENEK
jgi:superfamily I DNA and/or RNA helicase